MIRDHNRRWYLFKKAIPIFPLSATRGDPARPFIAAVELEEFYADIWRRAGPGRRLLFQAIRLAFHIWLTWRVHVVGGRNGQSMADRRHTLALARRRLVDPKEIVSCSLQTDEDFDHHFRRYEEAWVNKLINPAHWRPGCAMRDKALFAARCAEAGLPHPGTYATCSGGEIALRELPPPGPLFVKPTFGTGGIGPEVLDVPEGLDEAGFRAFLARNAGLKADWMAQEMLENHADIAPFAMDALSTIRFSTILNEQGAPELVACALKAATRPGVVVDNSGGAGVAIGVSVPEGVLGVGVFWMLRQVCEENPPSGGVRFSGARVPFFAEARALAEDAHARVFPEYAYVGWDIAITPSGPVMIEGNPNSGVAFVRRRELRCVSAPRYMALFRHHIRAALARRGG